MKKNRSKHISPTADRMGRFIGQLRVHEKITLSQLALGLCTLSHLGRIENGEREVGKQLTDALFQRLGKPAELFERILDWNEFQQWTKRQEIISHLHHGETEAARAGLQAYLTDDPDVLDRQFAGIIEINCRALSGAAAEELLPMVRDALALTQPNFQTTPVEDLLLSQNEGRLLFAYLQLREQMEGFDAVSVSYNALLRYFKNPRYERRERVYLVPYVACRVIENDYNRGCYMSALTVCEDALEELTKEKRLFAYDQLLEWKQKLYDAVGNTDRTPEKLLVQLKLIQAYAPKQANLLVPCDEWGHVYCLNQVIRDRRKLLGISQENLAEGICETRTLSRIENQGGNLHRKNRKLLLQRVNMSGERYDYEVITDYYEDYLLRSELDRAIRARARDRAESLLAELRHRIPGIPTNRQYILKTEHKVKQIGIGDPLEGASPNEMERQFEDAISLTLPLNFEDINAWPASILSINELMMLQAYALSYKKRGLSEQSLALFSYIARCLECFDTDASYYERLYTQVGLNLASILGDLKKYDESNDLLRSCLKVSLEKSDAYRLSGYLYGIVCNMQEQRPKLTNEEAKQCAKESRSLFKQAYTAAVLVGDTVGQRHIQNAYLKIYGTALTL